MYSEIIGMICCIGLYAGMFVGSILGGPWNIIAPAIGFGVGLYADTTMMKRNKHKTNNSERDQIEKEETQTACH